MATFQMKLRNKLKDGKYNLAVRVCHGNEVMYLKVATITKEQFNRVFVKKSTDQASIDFRNDCHKYIDKCERIFLKCKPFNKKRFSEMFYEKEKQLPHSLLLKDLFENFIDEYEGIGIKSKEHYRTTMNVLETFQPEMSVWDITPATLLRIEKFKEQKGTSLATIGIYMRNLRRIINYFTKVEKLIPVSFEYPFGEGKYVIPNDAPKKMVLSNKEIQSVVDFTEFDSPLQEYARDIWLFLYRCNGINFADLLRMRWDNIHGDYIFFYRKKTEHTTKKFKRQVVVPITPKLQDLIDKLGDNTSQYILGKMNDQYSESTFNNKNHKLRGEINKELKVITSKLSLSVPLRLKTARDSYASTLLRAGVSKDFIGEMMSHSTSTMCEHYLSSLDVEKTKEINDVLL